MATEHVSELTDGQRSDAMPDSGRLEPVSPDTAASMAIVALSQASIRTRDRSTWSYGPGYATAGTRVYEDADAPNVGSWPTSSHSHPVWSLTNYR